MPEMPAPTTSTSTCSGGVSVWVTGRALRRTGSPARAEGPCSPPRRARLPGRRWAVPRTGFIDHIGIGVPDLVAAKRYYDELTPILGLRAWFPTTDAGEFNYGPDGARGPQIFFYQ